MVDRSILLSHVISYPLWALVNQVAHRLTYPGGRILYQKGYRSDIGLTKILLLPVTQSSAKHPAFFLWDILKLIAPSHDVSCEISWDTPKEATCQDKNLLVKLITIYLHHSLDLSDQCKELKEPLTSPWRHIPSEVQLRAHQQIE